MTDKYKSGDLVTYVLAQDDASELNDGHPVASFFTRQIIKHEPAPEPKVLYVYYSHIDCELYTGHDVDCSMCDKIKLTYNPLTKEVEAECV